jgi:asparagine synthase (glutamine-hydrolysing)
MTNVDQEICLGELGRLIVNLPAENDHTIFRGVCRVEPGGMAIFQDGLVSKQQVWQPSTAPRAISAEHAAAEFRDHLVRATRARIRRAHGTIAAELSSGRDSSAVTATAAEILSEKGERLLAVTHAPRAGYEPPFPFGRLADESDVARGTAAIHSNINHRICRTSGTFDFRTLTRVYEASHFPVRQLSNLHWFLQNLEVARRAGASVLLNGGAGNFTISAGGPAVLSDLVRETGLRSWAAQALKLGVNSPQRWRMLLSSLVAAVLPETLYSPMVRAVQRHRNSSVCFPFLRQPYRSHMEELLVQQEENLAGASYREIRRSALMEWDQANPLTRTLAGIEVRDPTADRGLVEFCLSLPSEHLIDGAAGRPVYDRAMAGRVDPRVLRPARRGLQTADWHDVFRREDVSECFEDAARDEQFSELVDVPYVRELIRHWPSGDWHRWEICSTYRDQLLTIVATGSFLRFFRRQ